MNKFQIENLDFCQNVRDGSASIITGAFGEVEVDVDLNIETLVLVKDTAAVVVAVAVAAAAASIGSRPMVNISTGIFGSIA